MSDPTNGATPPAQKDVSLQEAFAQATRLAAAGRLGKANALIKQILAAAPGHVGTLRLHAQVALAAHKPEAAAKTTKALLARDPNDIRARLDMGMIYHAMGRYPDAEAELKYALEQDPDNAIARQYLGNVYSSMGRRAHAEIEYRQAIAKDPGLVGAYRNLAQLLLQVGHAPEAVELALKATELEPENGFNFTRLANALDRLGRVDEAIAAHERAVELNPDNSDIRLRYVESLAGYGRMDEAKSQCETILAAHPDNAQALVKLAGLTRFERPDPTVTRMQALLHKDTLSVHERSGLENALGKAFEDMGEYARAFAHFQRGNQIIRQRISYSAEDTARFFGDLRIAFPPSLFARHEGDGDPDPTPIFVIGMPRSGTSLTEQILSSHPKVAGAGELALAAGLARQICIDTGTTALSAAMPKADAAELQKLGRAYVEQLRAYAPKAEFIVDKMPANFLYAGLLKLVLPNAKFVHCRRDSLDNAFLIFKNHFTEGSLGYSYDMRELGHYYRLYTQLMAHWHKVLPKNTLFDLDYETLIADQEGTSRALLDHCGLDWTNEVLSFHKTSRPVHTASVAQVRQPIYKRSVGTAERYGAALTPLIEALGPDLVPSRDD